MILSNVVRLNVYTSAVAAVAAAVARLGFLAALFIVGRRAIAPIEALSSETVAAAPGARFMETRSGRVHYADAGEGTPVLLLHGSGRSLADWQEGVFQLLSQQHYVIAFPAASQKNREALEAAFRIRGTRAALLTYIRRQMTIDGARPLRGVFEDVQAPLLHTCGSEDENTPPSAARKLAQRTGGRFVLIEGAAHSVHTDAPDHLVDEIERFLTA